MTEHKETGTAHEEAGGIAAAAGDESRDDRRALLVKLGGFAAYTAPATLMLLKSEAVAQSIR